jgi:flavin-dependent dehydrogenase
VAGPFSVGCSRPWRANLVLVGDAAGFFDGITGEGMSVSLVTARHCSRACDGYLSGGGYAPFRKYASLRAGLVRNSELLGHVSLALGSRPALARMAVRNLQRRPETFNKLVAISTGSSGLRTIRLNDLSALLFGY